MLRDEPDAGRHPSPGAADTLLRSVYRELRGLAEAYLARERPGHTLQPTALVHEAFVRLASGRNGHGWESREALFAAAAAALRQILVDHARRKRAQKRGGPDSRRVTLQDSTVFTDRAEVEVLELDDALNRLARRHARSARVVELRFFGGLTMPEVARLLGVSRKTVNDDWCYARAWLSRALSPS